MYEDTWLLIWKIASEEDFKRIFLNKTRCAPLSIKGYRVNT